jgi:hypothetical protein
MIVVHNRMKNIFNSSWSAILSVPIVGFLFFFCIPWFSLTFLNSRSVVVATAILGFFLVPGFLARLHRVQYLKLQVLWILFGAISVLTLPKEFDGNPKMAFADHFLPGIMASLIFSVPVIVFLMKKKSPG